MFNCEKEDVGRQVEIFRVRLPFTLKIKYLHKGVNQNQVKE